MSGNKASLNTLKEQLKGMGENAFTIPNILSIIRIILIPVFVLLFQSGKYLPAVIVIFVSGLTDLFDGKIARHFNQISKLGKLLDPAADKLTQIALTVLMFFHFHSSKDEVLKAFSYVFLLFCVKELTMIVGSFILLSMDIVPEAAVIYGKVATFAFYCVMGLLLLFAPGFGTLSAYVTLPHGAIVVLVTISAVLTVVAFCSYIPDTVNKVRKKTKENEEQS
mgnify:FL=1